MGSSIRAKFCSLFALLAILPFVVSCGGLDPQALEGTWKFDHADSSYYSVPSALKFQSGKCQQLTSRGVFGCEANYRIDGSRLIVESSTTCTNYQIDHDAEINGDTLIIKEGDAKLYYKRTTDSAVLYGTRSK
jgi:hypothetical protein